MNWDHGPIVGPKTQSTFTRYFPEHSIAKANFGITLPCFPKTNGPNNPKIHAARTGPQMDLKSP
jgi:hypothetical protein